MHIKILAGMTVYNLYRQTRAILSCIVAMHIKILAGMTVYNLYRQNRAKLSASHIPLIRTQ